MIINLTYDPTTVNATTLGSAANLTAFKTQVGAAAHLFETTYLDPIAVNITIKYGPTGLGESNTGSLYGYNLSDIKNALKGDITSLDDLKTVNGLGSTGTVYVTHAQQKALGLIAANAPGSDGTITFSNTPGLIDFTHSSSMSSTSYDLYGVAAHEISEVMGREVDVGLVAGGVAPTILTQFNVGGNFTIGSESTLKFNTAPTGDRGDWDSTVAASDAFRAFASPGTVSTVSATDLRAVDVVGWDHKALDLVFAIDTTGSMTPYISNVKANAIDIVNKAFGTATAPIDTRIGIVGFKDAAGPNGPGENTRIINFTEQDTYDARKTAVINAINAITVGGGGDIPEGDNSALLYALQGNLGQWRRAAQDHKIILFTDAPIKDTGLAAQVQTLANTMHVTLESGSITHAAGLTTASFTFSAPVLPGEDTGAADSVLDGPPLADLVFSVHVYAIQVGTNPDATSGLTNLAVGTGGQFFTSGAANLADTILTILDIPPPVSNHAPQITSDGGGASASLSVPENTTVATTVVAVDPDADATTLTYAIVGGADQLKFTIDSLSGVLSFVTPPNYENPTDSGGDNTYDVVVGASDSSLTDTQALAITVTNVNEAPIIAPANFVIAENQLVAGTVAAADPEHDAFSFALAGGDDQAFFSIDPATGALNFLVPPDFETPEDANHDNVYNLFVSATDAFGASNTQAVSVQVTDLVEVGRRITGTNGRDNLAGTTGNDTVNADNANDVVNADDGNDIVKGENGNDVLRGGRGNDLLDGGNDDDSLDGGQGQDQLIGGNGNDCLAGGADNDILSGGNGSDILAGGLGDDSLTGGTFNDTFVFGPAFGNDVVSDFAHGDQIRFTGGVFTNFAAVRSAMHQVGTDTVITLDASDSVTLQHVSMTSLHASDFLFL